MADGFNPLNIFARVRESKGLQNDIAALQAFLQQQQLAQSPFGQSTQLPFGQVGPQITAQFPRAQSRGGAELFSNLLLQQQVQQGRLALQGPLSIADQRALEASRTGARPGTPGFERIATGPEPPATQSQLRAREIRRLQSIPKKQRTSAQSESLKRLLEGQSAVTINLPSPASPSERTEIAKTRASIDALNNIKELFDSAKTRTGPIVGRLDPVLGLFNRTTQEQENFMAATSAFRNKIIEEITGAQMSEVEASRILKQVPQETDPPARWLAKWQQSKKNLEFLQKRRLEILKQSGLIAPGQTPVKTKQPDIRSMSDEEIDAELRKLK